MAKKEYFLYGGLFLVGAVLTPAVVGLTRGGDRPPETTEENADDTEDFFTNDSAFDTSADDPAAATFAENDSREQILKDYETTAPEELRNIPTAIPEYALEQPEVQPYPNYWANVRVPNFASPPPSSSENQPNQPASANASGDRQPSSVATVPTLNTQTNPESTRPDFTMPPQENTNFQGQDRIQTPRNVNLQDFVNSAPARDIKLP
ncbi:hypothetical protein FLX56_13625 [Synechococcus moorigangaii CMS01]|nr:hypothetical protein [Synechococcus moorigangaii CMS01]